MTYEELNRLYYENGGQYVPQQETGEWGGMSGGYFQPVTLPDGRTIIPAEGGMQVTQMDGSERNYGELVMPDGTSKPLDYTGEERSFGSRLWDVAKPVGAIMGGAALLGAATGTLGGTGGGAAAAAPAAAPVAGATAPAAATAVPAAGATAAGATAAAAPAAAAAVPAAATTSWFAQNAPWLAPVVGAGVGAVAAAADDGQETTTSSLPPWLEPHAQATTERARDLSQTPYKPYTGEGVAPQTQNQTDAAALARYQAMQGDTNVNQARYQQRELVDGKMLNSNPYIDKVAQGIGDRMQESYATGTRGRLTAGFQKSGNDPRYSSAYDQTVGNTDRAFGDALGQTMQNLYYGNYRDERNAQDLAARFSTQFSADQRSNTEGMFNAGLQEQQTNQNVNNYNYQQHQDEQQWPFKMNDYYRQSVDPNYGRTTTTDDGVPWWMRAAGGAAAGAAAGRSLYPTSQPTQGGSSSFDAYWRPEQKVY